MLTSCVLLEVMFRLRRAITDLLVASHRHYFTVMDLEYEATW